MDIDSLGSGLRDGRFKNVVVMCGAGISTKAGVPDFRSPSAGLYFKVNVAFRKASSGEDVRIKSIRWGQIGKNHLFALRANQ